MSNACRSSRREARPACRKACAGRHQTRAPCTWLSAGPRQGRCQKPLGKDDRQLLCARASRGIAHHVVQALRNQDVARVDEAVENACGVKNLDGHKRTM
eukprot:scaffold13666_cov109-Isochrysis_galbana.AAC.2